MAGSGLSKRVAALEGGDGLPYKLPAIWVMREPGETTEEAVARYEVIHGPAFPGQLAVIWRCVQTGVPRDPTVPVRGA